MLSRIPGFKLIVPNVPWLKTTIEDHSMERYLECLRGVAEEHNQ
jgi:hypothetical protein